MDTATQEATIRERAYAIWEAEGRPAGCEWDHWERALREIVCADLPAPKAKARKTAKGRSRAASKSAISA